LDSVEIGFDPGSERFDGSGFGQSGRTFYQKMAIR
jgi:hypothetical protein